MGHFGICESVQSRDLSLSQPFWDILATMAYTARFQNGPIYFPFLIHMFVESEIFFI